MTDDLWVPTPKAGQSGRGAIMDRLARRAEAVGLEGDEAFTAAPGEPAYRIAARWITWECGCVAERVERLHGNETWEPVVFEGLPEQAVYATVCTLHLPAMDRRIAMGGQYRDWLSWWTLRRNRLIGKAA